MSWTGNVLFGGEVVLRDWQVPLSTPMYGETCLFRRLKEAHDFGQEGQMCLFLVPRGGGPRRSIMYDDPHDDELLGVEGEQERTLQYWLARSVVEGPCDLQVEMTEYVDEEEFD